MAEVEAATAAAEAALDLVGPPPPDVVAEAELANADERTAEVLRICKVLEATEQFLVLDKDTTTPDSYEVLGVASDIAAGDVRKRYFKLSLTVHPDKCDHPKAADAFNAADIAAKILRDEVQRKKLDAALEERQLRKLAAAQAEDQERARQWRLVKGTATEEDLKGPVNTEPEGRGTWMTELPVSRRPTAPQQVNVTSFSKTGPVKAVDSREWTETPSQKLMRLTAAAAAGPAALTMAPADAAADRKQATITAAMDAYNSIHRRKSLVEQHAEKLAADKAAEKKARKAAKKRKAAEGGGAAGTGDAAGAWQGDAPWRPFDRERDLQIGSRPQTPQEMLKKAGALGSRFGTSSSGRSFL